MRNKLTPALVIEAYKKTGLRPLAGLWNTPRCGCPLTALFCAENNIRARTKEYQKFVNETNTESIMTWAKTKFSINASEFICGFDGTATDDEPYWNTESEKLGQRVWNKVKKFFNRVKVV